MRADQQTVVLVFRVIHIPSIFNMRQNPGSQNEPENDPPDVGIAEFISWVEQGTDRKPALPKRLVSVEAPAGWNLERDRRFSADGMFLEKFHRIAGQLPAAALEGVSVPVLAG